MKPWWFAAFCLAVLVLSVAGLLVSCVRIRRSEDFSLPRLAALILLDLLGLSAGWYLSHRLDRPPPHAAPVPSIVVAAPSATSSAGFRPESGSVEEHAAAAVPELAVTFEGFALSSASCRPWHAGGYLCDLCYSHPTHILGYARVWCGAECSWILDPTDVRYDRHRAPEIICNPSLGAIR